jgi:hypothetical protein
MVQEGATIKARMAFDRYIVNKQAVRYIRELVDRRGSIMHGKSNNDNAGGRLVSP